MSAIMKLAPSILSADRKMLQKEVSQIEPYSDIIHVDIMDGKFVPPVTFSPSEIKKVKSGLPKDIHLMVKHPMRDGYIEKFVDSGGKIVSIHIECDDNIDECINLIKKLGAKASIAVKPDTPLEAVFPYLNGLNTPTIHFFTSSPSSPMGSSGAAPLNRGWVPAGRTRDALPAVATPPGAVGWDFAATRRSPSPASAKSRYGRHSWCWRRGSRRSDPG